MTSSTYYAILTDAGAALEATALATGVPVSLTQFVVGDGGGSAVVPDASRTTLVHEVFRGPITGAVASNNQVTFTLDVPTSAGGFTIREAGILTNTGVLYSLSNSPDILKPNSASGAVISITFKYVLAVSSTSTVTVTIYSDYLTPAAADAKYLQIAANLSEIKNNGPTAQQAARDNLGLSSMSTTSPGDYLATANYLSEISTAGTTAQQAARTNIGLGTAATADDGHFLSTLNYLSEIAAAGAAAQKSARLNIAAVASVNGKFPDGNGNVSITVSSTGIQNMRFGSEVVASVSNNQSFSTPGYTCTGYDSDGNENDLDHLYFRPLQQYITSWVTVGTAAVSTVLQSTHSLLKAVPDGNISQLINLKFYTPPDALVSVLYLIDEQGFDWYEAAPKMSGKTFVAYETDTGVIRQIDNNIEAMFPAGMSLAGFDSLPAGCDVFGNWVFDGTAITYVPPTPEQNQLFLTKKLKSATPEAVGLQYLTDAGAATPAQTERLAQLRAYIVSLMSTKLTAKKITWPDKPQEQ